MDKPRFSVQMTEGDAAVLHRLLAELKVRRRIPQAETVNRLILRLAMERAAQLLAEISGK